MATGGEASDICPFCLEIFTEPVFLNCFHTLCASCIDPLVKGGSLSCPSCHETTVLPPGGVEAMRRNFYIKPTLSGHTSPAGNQPADRDLCQNHEDQVLKFYCNPCKKVICGDCKLTSHENHVTEDLSKAAEDVKPRLREDQKRVRQAVDAVREKLDAIKTQQTELKTTQKEMEAEILQRHSDLLALADRLKAEAQDSLRATCKAITTNIVRSLQQREDDLNSLLTIQTKLENTLNRGPDSKVMDVAWQMESGFGSETVLNKVTSRPDKELDWPVQHNTSTLTDMERAARAFLGPFMASKMLEADVTVTKRFKCGGDPETSVFSLCHQDSDPPVLWVSFDQQVPMKKLKENGKLVEEDDRVGRVSNKRYDLGLKMSTDPRTDGGLDTYSKSFLVPHYLLDNDGSGRATLKKLRVSSFGNTKPETVDEIFIKVGLHRALDVSADETFVVVEELQPPNVARKVLMYRRPGGDSVTTYTPPAPTFQPSDVCFYTLGGKEVLLISDEASDSIHVVSVGEDTLTFQRYLTRDCPLLACPTAMNVDGEDRLWVACKGGQVLTIQPKARTTIYTTELGQSYAYIFPFTRQFTIP